MPDRPDVDLEFLQLRRNESASRGPQQFGVELSWVELWDGWPDWQSRHTWRRPLRRCRPNHGRARGRWSWRVVGGLTGALIGMGIPEYEAKRYEGRVKDGGILLSVHSDNSEWTKQAKMIPEETGAQDISSTGKASSDPKRDFREVA